MTEQIIRMYASGEYAGWLFALQAIANFLNALSALLQAIAIFLNALSALQTGLCRTHFPIGAVRLLEAIWTKFLPACRAFKFLTTAFAVVEAIFSQALQTKLLHSFAFFL